MRLYASIVVHSEAQSLLDDALTGTSMSMYGTVKKKRTP